MNINKAVRLGMTCVGVFILALILSSGYAYWRVSTEVTSDARQLVSFVEHKLNVAMRNLHKLDRLDYVRCDEEGQEVLKQFLFQHFNDGLFLLREFNAPQYTYCSVLGQTVIADYDRNFKRVVYLDPAKKQFPLAVLGFDWNGQTNENLFIAYKGESRFNVIRISLNETNSFFERDCLNCQHVQIRLANHDTVHVIGNPVEDELTHIKAASGRYPFYVDSAIDYRRVKHVAVTSLVFTLPLALLAAILALYLLNIHRAAARTLEQKLKRAIHRRELVAFYQPIVDAHSGNIVGAEALIRWVKPDGAIIPPAHFIQVLEQTQLINIVTQQLLENIPTDLAEILALDANFSCSLNLVPEHLEQPYFTERLEALAKSGFPVRQLAVEITERLPLKNLQMARRHVQRLKKLGVIIELDDAGTGYGGASYLQEIDIDVLKIDKLFVDTLEISPGNTPVLDAYIQMAKTLEMGVIAEGVEKREQAQALLERGVHLQQGYYFSRPLPAQAFVAFWKETRAEYDNKLPASAVNQ